MKSLVVGFPKDNFVVAFNEDVFSSGDSSSVFFQNFDVSKPTRYGACRFLERNYFQPSMIAYDTSLKVFHLIEVEHWPERSAIRSVK